MGWPISGDSGETARRSKIIGWVGPSQEILAKPQDGPRLSDGLAHLRRFWRNRKTVQDYRMGWPISGDSGETARRSKIIGWVGPSQEILAKPQDGPRLSDGLARLDVFFRNREAVWGGSLGFQPQVTAAHQMDPEGARLDRLRHLPIVVANLRWAVLVS